MINYGNLDNAEDYINEALNYGDECAQEEFEKVQSLLEAAIDELKQLRDELSVPDNEVW